MEFNTENYENMVNANGIETLWTSPNGKWDISVVINTNYVEECAHASNFHIMVSNDYASDFPVKYDDGRYGWDGAVYIPKYVKAQVKKMFKGIEVYGRIYDNEDFDKIMSMMV